VAERRRLDDLARRRRTSQGLARPARIVLLAAEDLWYYTPTSAAWINQLERFFALLTEKQLRRGVPRSTKDLEAAILGSIETVNADPKPFRWTKSADDILASIKRFCLANLRIAEAQQQIRQTSVSGY
jgi:hypothetical protein